MFSSEFDRTVSPLSSRIWGIVLGTFVMVSVAAGLVGSRSIPFFYGATVLVFVVAAVARGTLRHAFASASLIPNYLWLFLLYALASATWAADPQLTIEKTLLALAIATSVLVLANLLADETPGNLLHIGEGLWIGLTAGLIYLLIEQVTGSGIKIALFNALGLGPDDLKPTRNYTWDNGALVAIWHESLARNAAPITPWLWPAAMAIQGTMSKSWPTLAVSAIVCLAGATVFLSMHETSKVAFVVGLATFALATGWPRLTSRLVATGWIIASLVIVPSALVAHRVDLHNASWLQDSARSRIIIWNLTAQQTLNSPIFGVGATSTYVTGPELSRNFLTRPDEAFGRTLNRHAHNLYLQTWYELGILGAVLLALSGLAIVQRIPRIAANLQPYAYATFASAAAVAGSSYGMWQTWFIAMFAFSAVLSVLGSRLMSPNDDERATPS